MSKPPVRPAPKPVNKAAPATPPVRPPAAKPYTTQPPRIQTQTPAAQKNMTSPQYVPMGPSKPAVSGGNMAKAAVNAGMPSRGGTPVTVRDAPGYRGSGTQPMPSSQPRGFSKGGSASKRADGIAIRGKTRA